jgi:hypothetical protein
MRWLLGLCFLMCFCATTSARDDQADERTLELTNGRFWNSLPESDEIRAVFIKGIIDGWKLRGETEGSIKGSVLLALTPGSGFTFGELVQMVNDAYRQPENRSLPVGWVLMASMAIHRGETTKERVFPALRRHLSKCLDVSRRVPMSEINPIDTINAASQ